jgi:site-specific DNA-methyltransferase (adenine-specific)
LILAVPNRKKSSAEPVDGQTPAVAAEAADMVKRADPVPPAEFDLNDDGSVRQPGGDPPVIEAGRPSVPRLVYCDLEHGLWLYHANSLELLDAYYRKYGDAGYFDMMFADPPYFLSNGGITCHAGRMVKVDKGDWDKSRGPDLNHEFTHEWLRRCQRVLKPNGSIWVTGTQHVIYSVGYAMQQLGFKILNNITWEKPNPPPNLSCRYFTHSTETVIWAAKNERSRHTFNYQLLRQMNRGKQMKSVWRLSAPGSAEKSFGKHPTQKPVALVERCLLAATNKGDVVFDPFVGAGTTPVAAARLGRRCVGADLDLPWLETGSKRLTQTIADLKNQTPGLPTTGDHVW